jgi:hypothetical protein
MKLQVRPLIAIMVTFSVVLLADRSAIAQDRLDLYADQGMTQCSLSDTSPGLKFVHVFLSGPASATAVGFIAPRPPCWQGATWVGDALPGARAISGNTQTEFFTTLYEVPGTDPNANPCKVPPVLVCSVLFVTTGAALPCCEMSVAPIPHPVGSFLHLYYHDCFFDEKPLAVGQKVTINPDASCPCGLPVATEQSTWGRVKSLYR